MKVLIACERYGRVRDAFRKRGHYAVSCDIMPVRNCKPAFHIIGDVSDFLSQDWDLMIAHPPCTYLCNSGVRWLYNKDGSRNEPRWIEMYEAAHFFDLLQLAPIPKICIENPIMHRHAKRIIGEDSQYAQIIQPWQYGHGETKATCLWLKGLPKLKPTNTVDGRDPRIHKMSPSRDRGEKRGVTYQGVASAMAQQWG